MDTQRQFNPHDWPGQDFSAKSVLCGGVVRRSRKWVEAEIGLGFFGQTVRSRG